MHISTIRGEPRSPGSRNANSRLRKRGLIPAVVYGHGESPESVAVSLHDLEQTLQHKTHVVKIDYGSRSEQYLLKEVQYDHLDKSPLHVDLMRVRSDERVHVKVPVEFKGSIKTAHAVLVQLLSDVNVECLLLQIPESIRVNIGDLDLGDQIKVSDLELPPGVKVLHNPNELVATVRIAGHIETPVVPLEGPEAEAKEPEVIGRVAKEEPSEDANAGDNR